MKICEFYQHYYFFRPQVTSSEILMSSVSVLLVMLLLHLTAKYSWSKLVVMGLLAEYIYVIISITILHRGGVPEREASLIPFAFLSEIRVEPYLISEKLNNILLFIPLGVLLRMFKYKEQRLSCTRILLLGLTFSLSIETIQFITKRGVLETDDVFCNSIGCWIGGGIFYIFSILVKKQENENIDYW